ncbi:PQQ-binding-like beta-propeller repeat protein [Halorarius halobius]|uniref:outer membrane protein assembly factor BamB family protein n=1 Tax=Halorarius halobius TaxID=2962671 RepID=UPI0020CED8E0|nr:PQQ-binding-like beta-propeller repeat protein [Halorarius halobius]
MPDSPSISRRQALAAAGLATTGVGGYVAGVRTADAVPDWLAGRDCDPAPFVTDPTDWPFPRHDRANTGHAPARAAPDWPLERAWKREWPVGGVSTTTEVVVADGVALLGVQAAPHDLVFAVSLDDGRTLWTRRADRVGVGQPFAAGGLGFAATDTAGPDGGFGARSLADGAPLWHGGVGYHVPRTVAGGRLLASRRLADSDPDRTSIRALDARTGVECWHTTVDGWAMDVAVSETAAVYAAHDAGPVALDPASGETLWRGAAACDTVAARDGRLVGSHFPGTLRAFSLADGSVEWHVESDHVGDGTTDDGQGVARPSFEVGAVTPDAVLYTLEVHSDYPSRVQARDLSSGDLLWDVGPDPEPGPYHAYSRPLVVGDDVLVVRSTRSTDGPDPGDALLRLDAATGAERGRLDLPDGRHVLDAVPAGGRLFVATDERLLAFA